MGIGNITFDPYPTPLSDWAAPVYVYLYDRGSQSFTGLPNVICRAIQNYEGPHPPVARFEYIFDDSNPNSPFPTQFDQVWPITGGGAYVIQNDDELIVYSFSPDGSAQILFDGFAQIPQVDVTAQGQAVTFSAVGVAIRMWDRPIGGAVYRNADTPNDQTTNSQVATGLPTRFNPNKTEGGRVVAQPNCTPAGEDMNEGTGTAYPLFYDENVDRDPDPREFWTLGDFTRYLLFFWNQSKDANQSLYVQNPDVTQLDALLQARTPLQGQQYYDPSDSSTYTSNDIIVRDYDATGKALPDALAEQIGYHGFTFRFKLEADDNGNPINSFVIYRKDPSASVAPKDLYLQQPGVTVLLDVTQTNLQDLHVARDLNRVANQFQIETDPVQYEVAIVLAPLYSINNADATNRTQFLASNLTNATGDVRVAYRNYGADEGGDGHWDYATASFVDPTFMGYTLIDLTPIFGQPKPPARDPGGKALPQFAHRLRPPIRTLISTDTDDNPLKAQLFLSRDYNGPTPAVWDGVTGHWQPIDGGWELLDDRFGIRVTSEDVEQWDIGHYTGSNPQNNGRALRGITSQANPSVPATDGSTLGTQVFYLMLVAVIEGDLFLHGFAKKRDASPTQFAIERRIDAKDHFEKQIVTANSWYNQTAKEVIDRDDSMLAKAHSEALRAAHEFPPLQGTAVIPWLTNAYSVGDRIRQITGRNVTFTKNVGVQAGEAPDYPYIVSIEYELGMQGQVTRLEFSDRQLDPEKA